MNDDDLLSRRPRTKRVFSEADMARLRDLYYDPNLPLVDVADAFGVPVSTILRWTAEMHWPRKSTGWRPAGMAAAAQAHEPTASDEVTPHPAGSAGHPLPQGERAHFSVHRDWRVVSRVCDSRSDGFSA